MDLSIKVKELELYALGTWDLLAMRKAKIDLPLQSLEYEEN